jgi:hypothetical protein
VSLRTRTYACRLDLDSWQGPPWRLWAPDGPNGFAESDVSGYYQWHTPRTPALVSRELGDSRRASACPGVVMCLAGPSRSSEVARRAGVTPCHEADPERAGGRWWSGLTNSGGLRPGRIQRPAAGTRSGGSGEEYSGRSRRWHHPWRGASVAPPPTFPLRDRRPPLPQVSANTTTAQSSLALCSASTLSNPVGAELVIHGRDLGRC